MTSTIHAIPAILRRTLVGGISNVTVMLREHDSTVGHFSNQYAYHFEFIKRHFSFYRLFYHLISLTVS